MTGSTKVAHGAMRLFARLGLSEPELRGLRELVRPGDEVFDIGAAYGMYTVPLADIVGPSGRVHSFEPQPRQVRSLKAARKVLGLKHVLIEKAVLGADVGEHTILVPLKFGLPIYGHAHVAEGTELALSPQAVNARRSPTPMNTVDAWCEQHDVGPVSFLKVDVEGFEPQVLAGAMATIERSRPSMLLEIEDRHLGRYGRDANQFADEIRERWPEYRMYTWSGKSWTPTSRVSSRIRNYLFATDAAFAAARTE